MKHKFHGLDIDLETSLIEYGFIIDKVPHEDGSFFCIHMVHDDGFDFTWIDEKEINELITGNDWLSIEAIESILDQYEDVTDEIWTEFSLPHKVQDVLSYSDHGSVFGDSYGELMSKEEVTTKYLKS